MLFEAIFLQSSFVRKFNSISFSSLDKPEFTAIPPVTQTVNASANIRLQCNATGVPKPVISWTKDGGSKSLGSSEVLFLYNVNHKDKGIYLCKASNKIGNITASSNLLINRKCASAVNGMRAIVQACTALMSRESLTMPAVFKILVEERIILTSNSKY